MFRFMTLAFAAVTLLSAFVLYAVNYRTRALSHDLTQAERRLEALAREVTQLTADRAYLSRPSRIGPAATKLGMRPARGDQFVNAAGWQNPGNASGLANPAMGDRTSTQQGGR